MTYAERKQRLSETFKPRHEWWSRVFATPVACAILHLVADWKFLTPNGLTAGSLTLTLLTAGIILFGSTNASSNEYLVAAILLQVAYIMDCMDGQLARYRGITSAGGAFFDKWSDFIKFPAVVLALSVSSLNSLNVIPTLVIGFLTLFFICYEPYLRFLASAELGLKANTEPLIATFIQRNMRFFLFEEAQWYLIVSACLLFSNPSLALYILCATQGVVCVVKTIGVYRALKNGQKML